MPRQLSARAVVAVPGVLFLAPSREQGGWTRSATRLVRTGSRRGNGRHMERVDGSGAREAGAAGRTDGGRSHSQARSEIGEPRRWRIKASGWRRSVAAWLAGGVAFLLLGVAVEGLAQTGTVKVQVQPADPTTQDAITLVLSGEWKDSCVPRVTGVEVAGGEITISTESWGGICLMVITPWRAAVPLGRLPTGWYTVTVLHTERSMPPRTLGLGWFTVGAARCTDDAPVTLTPEERALVWGNTAFALDLYRELRDLAGNLFLSPYNISLCLAMAYAGARGETQREMAEALRFSLSQDLLHPTFSALDRGLRDRAARAGITLATANAFWGQEGWPFRRSYKDLLAELYRAELFGVPFATNPEGSRGEINAWVSDKTRGKIPELLPPGSVDRLTQLILTSAIYFYGTWKYEFDPALTQDRDFYLLDGSVVQVPMMESEEITGGYNEGYLNKIAYQAVELPYTCGAFSMVLLVPEQGRFREFEEALTAETLTAALGGLYSVDLLVVMPKFTFRSKFSLAEALARLGISSAFSPRADFSGMEETGTLLVGDVIHEAFIAVDEEGTEAAAATAIPFVGSAPWEIVVDRPFVFLIRNRGTGTILFLGRVVDPRG